VHVCKYFIYHHAKSELIPFDRIQAESFDLTVRTLCADILNRNGNFRNQINSCFSISHRHKCVKIQNQEAAYEYEIKYRVSVNGFSDFDTSLLRASKYKPCDRSTKQISIWRYIGASCEFFPLGRATFVSTVKWRPGRRRRSVLAFHETKSVVTVQRQFGRKYGKSPPKLTINLCLVKAFCYRWLQARLI
jgi:hypothetical protein